MKSESAALLRNYFLQAGISVMWLLQEAFHMWTIDHRVSPFVVSILATHVMQVPHDVFVTANIFATWPSQQKWQSYHKEQGSTWGSFYRPYGRGSPTLWLKMPWKFTKEMKAPCLKYLNFTWKQGPATKRRIPLAGVLEISRLHFFHVDLISIFLTISMYTSMNIGCNEGRFVNSQVDLIRAGKEEV